MMHLKIVGLAVVAAAAFMAFAGSASAAPTLTSPTGTEYTGALTLSAESSLLFKATFANVTCTESSVRGKVTTNNETEASGPVETFTFSNCGSNDPVAVTLGTLRVTPAGEVKSSGITLAITNTSLGVVCAYSTITTKIGTLTQSATDTSNATLDISASLLYDESHSTGTHFICGDATWSGSYIVTSPVPLFLK